MLPHERTFPKHKEDRYQLLTAAREERWRGPEEMRDFYRSLDVYLCASRSEGAPNTCLEAAACGVPLVTTAVAEKIVRRSLNADDQRDLVKQSLDQLQSVSAN